MHSRTNILGQVHTLLNESRLCYHMKETGVGLVDHTPVQIVSQSTHDREMEW